MSVWVFFHKTAGKKAHITQRKTSQNREEPSSVKPWSNKGQRQAQNTPALREAKTDQAVQSWAWPDAFVAGQGPYRRGPVHALEGKCNIPEYADTPGVNTYASFATEMLQGPWNRQPPTNRHTGSKNTLFLISCAPPVIAELAGKAEAPHVAISLCSCSWCKQGHPREKDTLNSPVLTQLNTNSVPD